MGSRRRSKMGMFDHAKYSQPVLRIVPDSVLEAVKDDVIALLNGTTAATRAIPGKKRHYIESDNNNNWRCQQNVAKSRDTYHEDLEHTTKPPIKKTIRSDTFSMNKSMQNESFCQLYENEIFVIPPKISVKEFANKLLQSHPTTTLRTNEPMTLVDASFSLARRALMAAKKRQEAQQNDNCLHDSDCNTAIKENSATSHIPNKSPFRTLSDQTMFIQNELDSTNIDTTKAKIFDQNASYLEESPMAEQEDFFEFQDYIRDTVPHSPLMSGSNSFQFDLSTNNVGSSSVAHDYADFNSILNDFSDINPQNSDMHYSRELYGHMNSSLEEYCCMNSTVDASTQHQYKQLITETPVTAKFVADTMEPFNFF